MTILAKKNSASRVEDDKNDEEGSRPAQRSLWCTSQDAASDVRRAIRSVHKSTRKTTGPSGALPSFRRIWGKGSSGGGGAARGSKAPRTIFSLMPLSHIHITAPTRLGI